MCGIVGIVTKHRNGFSYNELNMFQMMLFVDTFRGWDSTGVFGVNTNNEQYVVKGAVHGPDFLCTPEWKEMKADMISKGKFLVGHNRAATRGTVSDSNAHPFNVDDKIFLVQNGTYRGSHHHLKNTEVDTEAIAHVIAENDNIETALQKVNASYALVWYNAETKKLHIIRNNERPLWIAYFKDGGFAFASEPETILYAASKEKIELKSPPYMLSPKNLGSITLEEDKSYTEAWADIKSDYVYQGSSGGSVSTMVDDAWAEYYNERYGHGHHGRDLRRPPFQHKNNHVVTGQKPHDVHNVAGSWEAPTTITKQFVPDIMSDNFQGYKDYFNSPSDAQDLIEYVRKYEQKEGTIIEVVDYVAANRSSAPTAWWVHGSILDPSHPSSGNEVIRWLVRDKTEQEMNEYVKNGFFSGKVAGVNKSQLMRHGCNFEIVSGWLTDVSPIHVVSNEVTQ